MHFGQAFSVALEHAHDHDSLKPQQRHRHNIPPVHHARCIPTREVYAAFSLPGDPEPAAFSDFWEHHDYLNAPEKVT
jgi:hypothetical protein